LRDAPRDGRPRAFGAAAEAAGAAPQSERAGERLDDLIEFSARAFAAHAVVHGIRRIDLVLKVTDARLDLAPRAMIEHGVGAALVNAVGQLEAVDLLAGTAEQPCEIVEAFLVREVRFEVVERDRP
jgi:hypothetical protein